MSRRKIILPMFLILVLLVLLFPVHVTCGTPAYACATEPDPHGIFHTYYEIEPLGISMLESVIDTNLPLYYWAGNEGHPINPQ